MKKIWSVVLALALMAGFASLFTFSAAEGYEAKTVVTKVEDNKIRATVSLTMPAADKITAFGVDFKYDPSVLTPVQLDAEEGDGTGYFLKENCPSMEGWNLYSAFRSDENSVYISAIDLDVTTPSAWDADGATEIIVLEFTINEGASIGSEDILQATIFDLASTENTDIGKDKFDGVTSTVYDDGVIADEIVGIEVTPPTKVNYLLGETFVEDGLVVQNVYQSGKKAETTGSYDVPELQEVGTFEITVTASGFSDSFTILVSTKGDINADGKVSLADVILVARTAVGSVQDPNSAVVVFGDVIGGDGKVTLADVLKIARVSLGTDTIE